MEQYLEKVSLFVDNPAGLGIRSHFKGNMGNSELAMLTVPTKEELDELRRAVAIMTPAERQRAAKLTDEDIEALAADARVDPANLAIFINGYALHCKRVS